MNDSKITMVFTEVIKSEFDSCDYKMIRLQNGLEALLVHDPKISSKQNSQEQEENQIKFLSAAAISVGVGSIDSPIEVQGLAHLLEHMVVKENEKFPDANEFDRYISIHGGQSNEETHAQHTCFHFEVKPEFLKGALERLSQGIISPLLKEDSLEREINALDSEFDLEKDEVERRLQRLQCHSSKSGHPYNRFLSGNKNSLMDATDGYSDLRKKILEFHSNHYHGGKMKLVVIGGESLDVLQSWVVEFFTSVKKDPRKERRKVYLKVPKKAYFQTSFWAAVLHRKLPKKSSIWKPGKIYKQKATSNVQILYLSWTLPCLRKQYLKPEEYLFHFLGHGGKGSLIALLKASGWATSLECGVPKEGICRTSIAYIFVIAIHLTDSGLEEINTIIGFVYQYLKFLRKVSPPKWILEEIKAIGKMAFRFPEEKLQMDFAAKLSESLIFYSPKDVICADYVYKWDKQLVKQILRYFVPGNMRVDIVSNGLKTKASTCEPWFQIRYSVEAIDQDLMKLWKKMPKANASLHYPRKNKFLTNDFSLRDVGVSNLTGPTCMVDEKMSFWYKQSSTFKVPIASIYIRINFKGSCHDVKKCTSSELFIYLLNDRLSGVISQARIARLETSLCFVDGMLELKVSGFNEKLPELFYHILSEVNSFMPTDDQYKFWKKYMEKKLLNDGNQFLKTLLCEHLYDNVEKFFYLEDESSFDDLQMFIKNLRSQLYIEGLCYGNLTREEAETICNKVKEIFSGDPLPFESRHVERVVQLPPNEKENPVKNFEAESKFDINSVTEIYYQFEQDLTSVTTKSMALIDLFDVIVEQPFYNQMRTKEQLGYVVDSLPLRMHGVSGFRFRIISSKYNPDQLQLRIDSFIDQLEGFFNDLDDEAFENYKSALLVKLLGKDLTLVAESDRLWTLIVEERCKFDLPQKKAEEIKVIAKKDMIEWCKMYLNKSSPKCRRLQVNFWGWGSKTKKKKDSTADFRQISKFKRTHGFIQVQYQNSAV